ncbi:MAG: hypothetical protein V1899_02485, partial [Planctomycetota bacterium]
MARSVIATAVNRTSLEKCYPASGIFEPCPQKREDEQRPEVPTGWFNYPGGFNMVANFLRVEPSVLVSGQSQVVYIQGAELADPGEVVSPGN